MAKKKTDALDVELRAIELSGRPPEEKRFLLEGLRFGLLEGAGAKHAPRVETAIAALGFLPAATVADLLAELKEMEAAAETLAELE